MGCSCGAVIFKNGKLAIGDVAIPVLAAIKVPKIEIPF